MLINDNTNPRYDVRIINDFIIPHFRTNFREKSIAAIRGPKYWNSIPNDIKAIDCLFMFKKKLRKYLTNAYSS
jgi:hypothetical protein